MNPCDSPWAIHAFLDTGRALFIRYNQIGVFTISAHP